MYAGGVVGAGVPTLNHSSAGSAITRMSCPIANAVAAAWESVATTRVRAYG